MQGIEVHSLSYVIGWCLPHHESLTGTLEIRGRQGFGNS